MKPFRRTVRYKLSYLKKKEEMLEELNVELDDEKLRRYKSNLLRHVKRMNNSRFRQVMLKYRRRGLGGPLTDYQTSPKRVCQGLTRDG
jgi:hypothetical protein